MQITVWKEQILLHWSGEIPPNCDLPREHVVANPDLLRAYWKTAGPFMRWSTSKRFFFMALSKQNLNRIYREFGKIPVTQGYFRIEDLKSDLSMFKTTCKYATGVKNKAISVNVGYKMPPLAEYQHLGVSMLVAAKQVALFADCGCLSGDTEIRFSRGGGSRKISLRDLYKKHTSPRGNFDPAIKTMVRSFTGERIILHPIVRVVEQGEKEVLLLSLKDGKSIKATPDHEIMTKRGWVEMKDLLRTDEVMVDNLRKHQKKEEKDLPIKRPDKRLAVGKHHPYARKQLCHGGTTFSFLVEEHRAIFEAHQNDLSLEEFIKKTYSGCTEHMFFLNPSKFVVHHKNGDHYDNSVDNLEMLDKHEHMRLHARGYSNFEHGIPQYSKVVSVKPAGREMTYDIVCEDPHRNFAANGIVVHNCGKTFMVLNSCQKHIDDGVIERGKTLVCAKLATLETGWVEDCKKFTNLKPGVLWAKPGAKRKEKMLEVLNSDADIFVINHEGLKVLEEELVAKKFQKVVVDESTILKSFFGDNGRFSGGKLGRCLMHVAAAAQWRVIMSGTPAPNTYQDLWGQFHFLDPNGFMLEKTIHDFRRRFMREVFFGNPNMKGTPSTWKPSASPEEVWSLIEPVTFRVRIRDHLHSLPEKTVITRDVLMDKEQEKHYKDMMDMLASVVDDEMISVQMKLAQIAKLRQITGGFIIDAEEQTHAMPKNPKLDMLDQLLNEEIRADEKVVIYCQFRWEIETLAERYKDYGVGTVYGGQGTRNLDNIKAFINDPSMRIIILHPKSAAHGVTFTCAHYMIFYSISYSAEDDYQCQARIERAGQKHPMFIYYLIAQSSVGQTIDGVIFEAIRKKIDSQGKLIDQDAADNQIFEAFKQGRTQYAKKPRSRKVTKKG